MCLTADHSQNVPDEGKHHTGAYTVYTNVLRALVNTCLIYGIR